MDSGYPNRRGYLAPYKGTKYHLQEYRLGTMPRGMKETFNYAHSSLRNAVERSFGVLKQKWRIMYGIPSFPLAKQSKIIVACMGLHNFLRENGSNDDDVEMEEQDDLYTGGSSSDHSDGYDEDELGDADMNAFREQIARALYNNR